MPVCCVCGAPATHRHGNVWSCEDPNCCALAAEHGPRIELDGEA